MAKALRHSNFDRESAIMLDKWDIDKTRVYD